MASRVNEVGGLLAFREVKRRFFGKDTIGLDVGWFKEIGREGER